LGCLEPAPLRLFYRMGKMNIFIFLFWLLILIITGFLTSTGFGDPIQSKIRVWTPTIGLFALSAIEYFRHFRRRKKSIPVMRRILAIPFLTLGFNWICIYTLTTYRSHLRHLLIPVSIVFFFFGLALTHYGIYQKDNLHAEPDAGVGHS
jgi:hypothetical protein